MTASYSPNDLDLECLVFLGRFIYARGPHLAGATGASPWTIRKRLRLMQASQLVRPVVLSVDLTDASGRIRASQAHIWKLTKRGAQLLDGAGRAVVPYGYPEGVPAVTLNASRARRQMSDHTLGVASLAVAYRRAGVLDLVAEREVLALERPPKAGALAPAPPTWAVQPRTVRGVHPPDLGIVVPGSDGPQRVAVELERSAGRDVGELADVLAAYADARMPVRWHVLRPATSDRIATAAERIGQHLSAPMVRTGYRSSSDRSITVQLWRPERIGGGGPGAWPAVLADPRQVAIGLTGLTTPTDRSASWRQGSVVDPDAGVRLPAPASPVVPAAAGLPSLPERLAILKSATEQAGAGSFAPGPYHLAPGLVADWDGSQFRGLRAA